jgi:circadian clock protein KaiC
MANEFGDSLNRVSRLFRDMADDLSTRISSGLPGLDEVLDGGLIGGRSYMVSGESGTGKTIVGYHFLEEGSRQGESTLFVAFEETEADVRANAASLGIDLADTTVLDLSTGPDQFVEDSTYSVFSPSEVEGQSVAERIADAVEAVDPDRVFVDPLNQLRHLTPDGYQFERTAASLMQYLERRGATVLFSAQETGSTAVAEDLQYLCDGAISLRHTLDGRTIRVMKLRGSGFRGGRHDMEIRGSGIEVFPRLVPSDYGEGRSEDRIQLSTGVDRLDALLGGGIERGTVTVVAGPSGVGKTTFGTSVVTEAVANGDHGSMYLFEEAESDFRHRSEAIGFDVTSLVDAGTLTVEGVEPLERSPGEFAQQVRAEVEANDPAVVMIDGTSGYRLSLREDDRVDLVRELHALCRYLKNVGVTVVLTEEVSNVTGEFRPTEEKISYLADNIVFLRYLEVQGRIHKATGVLKKRFGDFEPSLREFRVTADGIEIGEPLENLRGVLTGTPEWIGEGRPPSDE